LVLFKKVYISRVKTLKYEVQFFLPKENKWLAPGSFNNHLTTLINKYKITKNLDLLFGGCLGFDLEDLFIH
jgi:hypothetical protein